ncbi:hypothetical protein Tco_0550497 [Tanacetum coccineum]
MSFAKRPGKDTPQCYVKPLDSLKNWNNRFFWVDERVFPTPVAWRSSAPRDNKPTADNYSEVDVATLDTHRTSFGDGSIWSDQEPEPQGEGRYASSCCSRGTAVASHRRPSGKYGRDTHYFDFDPGTPSSLRKSSLDVAVKMCTRKLWGQIKRGINPMFTTVPQQEQPAAKSAAAEVPPETNLEQEVLTMGLRVNKRRTKRDRGEMESSLQGSSVEDGKHRNPRLLFPWAGHTGPSLKPIQHHMARRWIGSQLRLRFEQESKLLKKSFAKIGRREQKIQVQDDKIRNLESLIEAESDMKRAAEAKNETLTKELEDLRAHFSKLQVDSKQLTQQVATLQAQVTREEKIKAAFEVFQVVLEGQAVEQQCVEMDA